MDALPCDDAPSAKSSVSSSSSFSGDKRSRRRGGISLAIKQHHHIRPSSVEPSERCYGTESRPGEVEIKTASAQHFFLWCFFASSLSRSLGYSVCLHAAAGTLPVQPYLSGSQSSDSCLGDDEIRRCAVSRKHRWCRLSFRHHRPWSSIHGNGIILLGVCRSRRGRL